MTNNSESLLQKDELKNIEESVQDEIVQENEAHEHEDAYSDHDEEIDKLRASNKKGLGTIDAFVTTLWNRRFWTGVFINISLIGSALYNGKIFIVCVILTALFHILDKYTDFKIHVMHQKREYVKYGY